VSTYMSCVASSFWGDVTRCLLRILGQYLNLELHSSRCWQLRRLGSLITDFNSNFLDDILMLFRFRLLWKRPFNVCIRLCTYWSNLLQKFENVELVFINDNLEIYEVSSFV